MKVNSTIHKTKHGNQILIREAKISDAKGLIECAKSYMKNGYIPLTEGEFNPTVEEHERWIKSFIENANNLLLVVEAEDVIIGK